MHSNFSGKNDVISLNPIQDGLFWGCSRMGEDGGGGWQKGPPLPKICYTFPTMMKLGTLIPYLEKIENIYKSRDTPFLLEISKFCYVKKYRYRLYFDTLFWYIISNSLTFFEFWKIFLINMLAVLMMSAKMAALDLFKIKVFWNIGYDVITSVYDVINRNLSRDSNYVIDVIMWPKFRNSSTSMMEVIITSFL